MISPTLSALAEHGLCSQVDPELFFPPRGGSNAEARRVCGACPVRQQCLEVAMAEGVSGIWGGTSHKQRIEMGGRRDLDREDLHGCGTEAGARRHYRAGEQLCEPCRAAGELAARRRRADRRAA